MDGGEVRDVVLDERLVAVEIDGSAGTVGAPFVVAIPEILQPEVLDGVGIPRVPQPVQLFQTRLQHDRNDRFNSFEINEDDC